MDSVEDDGLRSREPDYLFRPNGFPHFVVEAKKPAVDIDTNKKAIYQAKRYAWNASIPFAILTDFEQFRVYDATLKPILNEPSRGLIKDFVINFQDYPNKWETLVATGSAPFRSMSIRSTERTRRPALTFFILASSDSREPAFRSFYISRQQKRISRYDQ